MPLRGSIKAIPLFEKERRKESRTHPRTKRRIPIVARSSSAFKGLFGTLLSSFLPALPERTAYRLL
jgi:hypothetical protein